jgi:hypothetical protein
VLRHSCESHADFPLLQVALGKIEAIALKINESKRAAEQAAKLFAIQDRVAADFQIFEPSRHLLRTWCW